MTIGVTGAAGFIGSNLCNRLMVQHRDVVGLDDLSTGFATNLEHRESLRIGTILNRADLESAFASVSSIVHLAALPSVPRSIADPLASHQANATGTAHVLETARLLGSPQVIVASSSSVYGSNPHMPKHEGLVAMPMSPYAASKLATEQYALAWQHSYGLRTLAFRFFNVFGPGQAADHAYAAVIPSFISAALREEPVVIHGDGQQSRDFTYVGTVCDVIADAAGRGISHPTPVNLAFGSRITLLEVVDLLEVILGKQIERTHVGSRAGDVRHSQADNTLLRSLFPDVAPISFEEGLRATVDWMQGQVRQSHSS